MQGISYNSATISKALMHGSRVIKLSIIKLSNLILNINECYQ
jgi:hypothetical protein